MAVFGSDIVKYSKLFTIPTIRETTLCDFQQPVDIRFKRYQTVLIAGNV